MIRVLIAGEGPNELGDAAGAQVVEGERHSGGGLIEAFMTKVRVGDWRVVGRMHWKDIAKLRVDARGDAESRSVRALVLKARELGCNALVFLRDRDRDVRREKAIQEAVKAESARLPTPAIAAGVPIEMLECWLLSLRGEPNGHADPSPSASLESRHGVAQKKTTAMVQLVRNARLLDASHDAQSLWRWLRELAQALVVRIPKEWPTP